MTFFKGVDRGRLIEEERYVVGKKKMRVRWDFVAARYT